MTKEEIILEKFAVKNMVQWNQKSFKRTHPRLHKSIIEAIKEAGYGCPNCGSKDIQRNPMKASHLIKEKLIDGKIKRIDKNGMLIRHDDLCDLLKEYHKEQLAAPGVSQQRELLKAFANQWNSNGSQLINDAQIGNFLNSL